MDYTVNGNLQARILEWVVFPLLQGNLPNPRIEARSPILQADSLPAEPEGKPRNTGVGSLSRSSQPINPTRVLLIEADSLPTELSEKSINKVCHSTLKNLLGIHLKFSNEH